MQRSILFVAGLVLVFAAEALWAAQAPALRTGPARALPSTVLNAFEKSYPDATITDASPERRDGRMAFRVEALDKGGRRRVVLYELSGTVIEAAEQVDEDDLPAAVAAAMKEHRASYVRGMKVTRGAVVRYELTLRGTRKATMVLKEDGTIITLK